MAVARVEGAVIVILQGKTTGKSMSSVMIRLAPLLRRKCSAQLSNYSHFNDEEISARGQQCIQSHMASKWQAGSRATDSHCLSLPPPPSHSILTLGCQPWGMRKMEELLCRNQRQEIFSC
jgi:hypothetical protein